MDFDLWNHSFCLACDREVQSSTDAYCSESWRLADFQKTSTTSPPASTSTAYDFNAEPYGVRHMSQLRYKPYGSEQSTPSDARSFTPSGLHSSLHSMQSTSTTGQTSQLSDDARKELRAYVISFEQVRMQRRRLY
ncbi:hypothetical protein QL093DRAFT_2565619 [Fusarium oxysporum]|nr:hypothetical protein QL093DRAFT_2565619 [Fusarium oxysporum]